MTSQLVLRGGGGYLWIVLLCLLRVHVVLFGVVPRLPLSRPEYRVERAAAGVHCRRRYEDDPPLRLGGLQLPNN